MSESFDKKSHSVVVNTEIRKQSENRESEYSIRLAQENPGFLAEKIQKNPASEPLLRRVLGDRKYDGIKDSNTVDHSEVKKIDELQRTIYSFVDIHSITERNGTKEKFIKGLIDSIVIENGEFALKIIETQGGVLRDLLEQMFTWEGLKQIAEGLKTSVTGLFSGDAYQTGKSFGELGLVSTGTGVGVTAIKKIGKGISQSRNHMIHNSGSKAPFMYQIGAVGDIPRNILSKQREGMRTIEKGVVNNDVNKEFPFLSRHAEFLGELGPKDILGQGVNGVIVRHPNKPDTVVKIAKEGMVDDLTREFDITQEFYMALEKGRRKYSGKLSENVRIPKVYENPIHTGGYFLIERIDGQNLNTKFYREYYKDILSKKYLSNDLDLLTDAQFDVVMKENGLHKVSPFGLAENDFEGRLLRSEMERYYYKQLNNTELGNTLGFLGWIGYHHNDFRTNPGNIMVDREGKIFIIDFGKAVITPTNR